MAFPGLNTVNASNDLTQILIYTNTITGGKFMPMVLFAFFIIICVGSFFAQIRFSGRGKFEVSFAVAGFSTFGFSILMMLAPGLINTIYVIITLVVAIIGALWLYFSTDTL